jgi:hypothetical protein
MDGLTAIGLIRTIAEFSDLTVDEVLDGARQRNQWPGVCCNKGCGAVIRRMQPGEQISCGFCRTDTVWCLADLEGFL